LADKVQEKSVQGKIVEVDEHGNVVSDLTNEHLAAAPRGIETQIQCGGHTTLGIFPPDHDQDEMTFIAVLGEEQPLTLMLVGDSAHRFLSLGVGDTVTVKW